LEWSLSRIKTLIGCRFHNSHTVQRVAAQPKQHGWTCQIPTPHAIKRNEDLVAGWMKKARPAPDGTTAAGSTPGSSSPQAGFSMTAPTICT
jgi:hypothetical protein